MPRLVSLLALSVLPAGLSGPALDPPSSLRPAGAPGKVRLSHEHRRVLECQLERDTRATECRARAEAVRAGTRVTIRPVDAQGNLIEDDARSAVHVEFDNVLGVAQASTELAPGAWELSWPGLGETARFGVAESDEFSIGLRTMSGACEGVEGRCLLKPDKVHKTARIPPDHRLGP